MAPSPQRPQRAKAAIHRRRHSASARCTVGRDGDDKVGWTSYKFPDCDIPRCMPSEIEAQRRRLLDPAPSQHRPGPRGLHVNRRTD
eukprot:jgi/Tetstr1/465848/TSEL_010468.t1